MDLKFEPFETYYTYGLLYNHFTKPRAQFFQLDNSRVRYNYKKKWDEQPSRQRFWYFLTHRFPNASDMRDHVLSVMVTRSPKTPLIEIHDVKIYKEWMARLHAMYIHFDSDLAKLRRAAGSLKKAIHPPAGEQPVLYKQLMSGNISMETFAWLVAFQPKLVDVMDTYFDSMDLAWKEKRLVATKYPVFLNRLNINQDRLKKVLRSYL